jgi:DNA-binding CsgD family transcriptional regulator
MAEFGEPLSKRETEVLQLVTTGATNRQIAQELVVSVNTVKVHLRNIFTKLGVESRTEATLIAIREGLVSVPAAEEELEAADDLAPPEFLSNATEDAPPSTLADPPQLPWLKRIALVAGLLIVTLVTVVTWPQSHTAAVRPSFDSDNRMNGASNEGMAGENTRWRVLAPMTLARSRFALAAAPNGRLYAIGGETNGGITGAIEQYDPTTDQWTPLSASKLTRTSNMGAAAIGEWIYVPGGQTAEGDPTAIVEAYNQGTQVWTQVAPLPRPLSGYALAVHQGQVLLFGGKDSRGYTNATFIYDPQQDEWTEGKAMPTRRAYAAAASLGSRIFVVGGYDGEREQATCAVYVPAEDSWDDCEPLTVARGGLGLAGVANELFAVGGGWSNYLGFSEKLDSKAEGWLPFDTPVYRQWSSLAVASRPDRFFVAGGWNGDYLNGVWEFEVLWHKIHIPAIP